MAVFSLTVSGGNIIAGVDISVSPTSSLDTTYYSSDDGSNWHRANLPSNVTFVPAVVSDGSSLAYAAVITQSSSTTGLYKSTDAGVTWDARTFSINVDLNRMAVKGNNVLGSTLFTAFYSIDFGESWTGSSPPGNCPGGCGIFTYTLRGNSIFAGLDAGMFLSTDQGASWVPFNAGFPACPKPDVEASCADDNYLYAGTFGDGVWRKPLTPLLALSRAVSRKSHGIAGTFDIDMPITGTSGVEDRSGGGPGTIIVLSFTNPVIGGSADATTGTGNVSGTGFSGNDMIISLTGVANEQMLTLTASGVTDINGNVLGPVSIPIGRFLTKETQMAIEW